MATTFDKASLVMIPSGVKEDKLYSIKPTDGSGDFTFSRGSDIQATRVNSSGLIEKAKVNYILYSNTFNDSSWLPTDLNVTSGATDPNGGSTAWTIANTAANGIIQKAVSLTGLRSVSIYAKQGTHRYLRMGAYGGTNSYANFDLQDGVVSSGTQAVIESVGGGWYRCTAWGANGTTGGVQIYPSNNATSAPTTSGNILIWRAQLNHGLIAQDYVETTTTAVVEGLTADLPRLDYSGGASCPSLLLEPSRTNVVLNSEYFDGYPQTRITLTNNAATSPEGVQNATKMVETTDTGLHFLSLNGSVTSSANAAFSIFAKQGENQFLQVLFGTSQTSPEAYANIDLSDGTYNDYNMVSFDTEDYGNGWYRIFGVVNSLVSSLGFYIASVQSKTAVRAETYTGDGTSGFYLYGGQLESSSSYPTSYIPTYGTAANRGAESCLDTSATALIGQTEGTLFFECTNKSLLGNARYFSLSDGTNDNRIDIYHLQPNTIGVYVATSGAAQVNNTTTTIPSSGAFKFALAYANNDYVWYVNGAQVGTDTSASVPACTHTLLGTNAIGGAAGGNNPFKQALVFKTRLTNAELAALTTI